MAQRCCDTSAPILSPVPAPTPALSSPASSNPALEKVLAFIERQSFEGWWNYEDNLVKELLGFDESKALPTSPQGIEGKVWMTLLIVVFLETKMEAQKGVWELVVEKARGWVVEQLGGMEAVEEWEGKALAVL